MLISFFGLLRSEQGGCRGARKHGQERWWAFLEHVVSGAAALPAARRGARGEEAGPLGRWGRPSRGTRAGGAEDLSSAGRRVLLLKVRSKDLGCC